MAKFGHLLTISLVFFILLLVYSHDLLNFELIRMVSLFYTLMRIVWVEVGTIFQIYYL